MKKLLQLGISLPLIVKNFLKNIKIVEMINLKPRVSEIKMTPPKVAMIGTEKYY